MRAISAVCTSIGLALMSACSAQAVVVAEHTGTLGTGGCVVKGTLAHAQAFDITGNPQISEIQLPISRWSGSTGWVHVDLCPDVNGEPGNGTAQIVMMASAVKKSSNDWVPFLLNSTLWPGRWWIVCYLSAGSDAEIDWWGSDGNTYGTGRDSLTSHDSGDTWPTIQKSDKYFRVFGVRTTSSTATTVTADPSGVTVNGRAAITVEVRTSPGGALVQGPGQVTLTCDGGSLGAASLVLENGKAETYWQAPPKAGSRRITAGYLGHVYGGSDYQSSSSYTDIAVATDNRDTTTTQNLSAGAISTRTSVTSSVTVRDKQTSLPVNGGTVVFTCTCSDGSFSQRSVNVTTSGQASTTWTAGNTVGPYKIRASYSGYTTGGTVYGASGDEDDITIDYTDVPTTTTVSISPTHPYVGGKTWVTVEVRDSSAKPVPGGVAVLQACPWGTYDDLNIGVFGGRGWTEWNAPADTAGSFNVTADYQQYVGGGNRYLPSSGSAPLQCVKDPDTVGGEMTWMTEWVTNYQWWQFNYSDLENTDDDARGFSNKLTALGWKGDEHGNDGARQDHFKLSSLSGLEHEHLDKHDFTYYSGHGSPDSISFNNLNDAVRLYSWQAFEGWGDKDAEWALFSACEVMRDEEDWAACMDGLHLQLGFTTTMSDSATFGNYFADFLAKNSYNDTPHPIAQAFFLAGDVCLNNKHKQRVIGETSAILGDYIWGQGPVGDDPPVDDYYAQLNNHTKNNDPPVADAGGPYYGVVGEPVTLDASRSWDPDRDDYLTYTWDVRTTVNSDSKDYDNDGVDEANDDGDAFGRHAGYTFDTAETRNIRLMVSDSEWHVDDDWATVVITSSRSGEAAEEEPVVSEEGIVIVDNFTSLPTDLMLPRFQVVGTESAYGELMRIADYYGVSGAAHLDDSGNYAMRQGSHELMVNKHTGAVIYVDIDRTYTFTHAPYPLPDEAQCLAIANGFLNSCGIGRIGAALDGFIDVSAASGDKGGRGLTARLPFQRCVDYRRRLIVDQKTYPVVGPGGKIRVVIDDYGDARGFVKIWREAVRAEDMPLVPANQAVQDFRRLLGKAVFGDSRISPCTRIEIDEVLLGYYEDDFGTYQHSIYPVYVLELTCEDERGSFRTQVYMPAAWSPVEARIDSPQDGAEVRCGDEVLLEGSAVGGTPPYTYNWYSDHDGLLGSGASIPVSTLGLLHEDGVPFAHTIELQVTDGRGVKGVDYATILVGPNPVADAKLLPDGRDVTLLGQVVTAVFPGFCYVEEPDRSSGIEVRFDPVPPRDCSVLVNGQMATVGGERVLEASSVEVLNQTAPIGPLGMRSVAVGGGDFGYPPLGQRSVAGGVGLNNIGLLVRVCGTVVSSGSQDFEVDDGSGCILRCVVPVGVTPPAAGSVVSATGVSSCEEVGPELHRLLRVRCQSDIDLL